MNRPQRRLFGTDGVRAPYGTPPLDRATITALAAALGRTLARRTNGAAPEVVIGGDTRASTPEICRWVAAGLATAGAAVRYVGTVPTPAVAYLTRRLAAAAGVVVSASHNPLPDNGVKLIDAGGGKWSEEAEAALEAEFEAAAAPLPEAEHHALTADGDAVDLYLGHLAAGLPAGDGGGPPETAPLAGLSLALDAANGAASPFARTLFERLGATVTALCDRPDGGNINHGCGSTHPERLAAAVAAGGHDLGFAFDGDADRALLVDETGAVRDGDAMLYLWARWLRGEGMLEPPVIVATSMSNLGLERALAAAGIGVVRCGVGDREVVETLRREGLVLGGEQSGHLVDLALSTTGDGLLTALHIACRVARERRASGATVSALLAGFRRFPQVLFNVRVTAKPRLDALPAVAAVARRVEQSLGRDGRLVLRYSGTEPLARVMIEGPDQGEIERLAAELVAAIDREIGAG